MSLYQCSILVKSEVTVEHFTPGSAVIGGALIGISAALLLFANGRIAGVSGILAGTLAPSRDGWLWRSLFVAGLVLGCVLVRLAGLSPSLSITASTPQIALAGFLVGYGTRLGNGCTSGHGVCGIARLSRRSIVATAMFMFSGGMTVFVVRHLLGA